MLKNANQKKEELKQRKIQEEIERENEKKRRAEEKARKKRERELQELRTMLNAEIIEKGETQEGAVKHRFTNEVGSYQPVPGGESLRNLSVCAGWSLGPVLNCSRMLYR